MPPRGVRSTFGLVVTYNSPYRSVGPTTRALSTSMSSLSCDL